MSTTALAKPSLVSGAVITCSTFGTAGTVYYMKVMRSEIEFNMKAEKTTGDGDTAQNWELDYMPVTRFSLGGYLVAASVNAAVATFVTSFYDSTKNPLTASFKLTLATAIVLTVGKTAMHGLRIGYTRERGVLPISFACLATDTNPASAST